MATESATGPFMLIHEEQDFADMHHMDHGILPFHRTGLLDPALWPPSPTVGVQFAPWQPQLTGADIWALIVHPGDHGSSTAIQLMDPTTQAYLTVEPFPSTVGTDVVAKVFPLPAQCGPLPALNEMGCTPVQILQPYRIAAEYPETLWDLVELSEENFLYEDGDPPMPEHVMPGW